MTVPQGFIAAHAARAWKVHLLPSEDGKLTSITARCGWKPTPSGSAPIRWYGAGQYDTRHQCPKCFTQPEDAMNDTTKPRTYAPSKPAAQAPAIGLTPVESSQLEAFGYDPATSTLAIRFKGHGGKPGSLYHYANFGETDYAALRDAESKGSHFIRQIKPHADRYPCTRIIETPVE